VGACYAACDAVVLSSLAEGIPLVLMEGMACHRPVVAPNLGAIAELVENGVNGYLFAAGNARELADALEKLLRDPAAGQAFGDAGARKVNEEFRLDVSAEKLAALFTTANAVR
jgi:glycosyltransferase involved in cell wall biosynthesis